MIIDPVSGIKPANFAISSLYRFWNIKWSTVNPWALHQTVDISGEKWYTILVNNAVSNWIKLQDPNNWTLFYDDASAFNINKELFVMLKLTWGPEWK